MLPSAPEMPDTRLSREPLESVSTLAETPMPAILMAEARLDRVPPDSTLTWGRVAFPKPSQMEPASLSDALATSVKYPLEVVAREWTVMLCVPAAAADVADASWITFLSELEQVFWASTPVK